MSSRSKPNGVAHSVRRLLVAVAVLVALAAHASTTGALEVVPTARESLDLEIHDGQLIRLDQPAATVFIANPDIADVQLKSPTLLHVFGKLAGETSLFAVSKDDVVLANLKIRVSHNLDRLRGAIARFVPGALVDVESVNGALVVSGEVASARVAEDVRRLAANFASDGRLINQMSIASPSQVHLRVRVAEVSRAVVKQFGFNWDALFSSGSFLLGIATGNPVMAAGSFVTRNGGTNSLYAGNGDLNVLLDALNDEGVLSILAEPNLTALSGETASFLAGGEYPIPVPQDDGKVTIEFKDFGVQLAFTPVVLDRGRISLHVAPEVSELTATGAVSINGFVIPALTTRRAETTVELGSGQSFAIAGLLKNNVEHDVSKFPGLGDLPVLGTLFRSDSFRNNETELVIIVTPYLVRPVSDPDMAAPNDGLNPPNDAERIFLGQIDGEPAAGDRQNAETDMDDRRLAGSVGFMLD